MTDDLPAYAIDRAAFARAYVEETLRRAAALADELHDEIGDARTEELASALYRLGVALDQDHGFNITGGTQ